MTSSVVADWEAYLQAHLAGHWQPLGMVDEMNAALQILAADGQKIVDAPVADLAAVWGSAIAHRLAEDTQR